MHEAEALGACLIVVGNLAGKNVAKGTEGIVQHLVINGLVQVLDEDVALAGLADRWIAVRPHDANRAPLDHGVVHGVQGTLSVNHHVEVDVGVAQRAPSDGVAADADGRDRSDRVEDVTEESLRDVGVQVSDVK